MSTSISAGSSVSPTSYVGCLAWYALPPKNLIGSPSKYVTLTNVSVVDFPYPWIGEQASLATASDPLGGTGAALMTENTSVGTVHDCYANTTNSNDARKVRMRLWVKRNGAARNPMLQTYSVSFANPTYIVFDLDALTTTDATTGATGSVFEGTGSYAGWYFLDATFPESARYAYIRMCNSNTFASRAYTGDGASGLYLFKDPNIPIFIQDGSISQLNDLSGNAYHWTQATLANMPYYMGELEADWSTGAPSIYNPGTNVNMLLNMPSALCTAASIDTMEIISYMKGYNAAQLEDIKLEALRRLAQ